MIRAYLEPSEYGNDKDQIRISIEGVSEAVSRTDAIRFAQEVMRLARKRTYEYDRDDRLARNWRNDDVERTDEANGTD